MYLLLGFLLTAVLAVTSAFIKKSKHRVRKKQSIKEKSSMM
jgi:hypothetical protein